jgi:L-iditol 2-dehydrogenase
MLAGILLGPQRIEIRDIETPQPARGEVLVKVHAALTCGTDIKAYMRGHPMIPMPGVFGHEFSGVIAKTGKGVRRFKEGDAVMSVHSAPCLRCRYCRKRLFNLCENIMDSKVLGAFAEYILLPEHIVKQNLFHKPAGLPYEEAAFLEPLACVVHSVSDLAIRKGARVLIIGAGPIGLLHLLLARRKGAKVIITGLEKERLDLARTLGAERTALPDNLASAVSEFSGGLGVDFVFECTGQVKVWEDSVQHLRRGGTVILFGGCKSGTRATYDTYRLHYDEITLKGVFHFMPSDVRKAYALLKGPLHVSPLISGSYRLPAIETAFALLSQGKGIKYVIVP